jgi:flagellar biosynthesis repressor protein FlbT
MALKLSLRENEKVIVNGAVISPIGRSCDILFHNRARILHEKDVLTDTEIFAAMEAEGSARNDSWLYYLIQLIYIDPDSSERLLNQLSDTINLLKTDHPDQSDGIDKIIGNIADGDLFFAMKNCQKEFPDCLNPKKYKKATLEDAG